MYSQRVVCIDSTHKTTPYAFKLVTVVVPDEFNYHVLKISLRPLCTSLATTGIPVAWGIVEKEDVPTLEASLKGFMSMSLELLSILL